MANMVIVTKTDYLTVYPTQNVPTLAISQITLVQTLGVPSISVSITTRYSLSIPAESSVALSSMSMPSGSSVAQPSTTGVPTLPSGWPAPATSSECKPWNDSLAKLSLAAIIIMAVLLHSFVAYAVYQRFRGKCHKCAINEDRLRKWESGELRRITKEMVKAREYLNSHESGSKTAPAASDIDLEAGNFEAERDAHRSTALAALNRPRSVVQEPSFFERAKGALKPKGKRPTTTAPNESSEPAHPSSGPSHDRFFAVIESSTQLAPAPQASRQPYVEDHHASTDHLTRTYDPSSLTQFASPSSIYSYDGGSADKFAVCPLEQPVRSLSPDGSVVSSALHIFDPRHRARYADAQQKMARGTAPEAELQKAVRDVNTIEAQMRGKRRSGTYGGLPDPEV